MDAYLWDYLTAISLRHDPLLDLIQDECTMLMQDEYLSGAVGRHMFNEKRLQEMRRLLEMPEQAERWRAEVRPPRDA
jgi:hypothetical protein